MTRSLLMPDPRAHAGTGGPLVTLGAGPPPWLREWCRRSGRDLEVGGRIPDSPPTDRSAHELNRDLGHLAGRTIWLAHHTTDREPTRIVAALDDLAEDAAALEEACSVARHLGTSLVLAHAVPVSFAERSVGLDAAVHRGRALLAVAAELAATRLPASGLTVSRLVRARPHELAVEPLRADLLVLGGPRPGRDGGALGGMLTSAVFQAPCSLLLAPRSSP